MVLCLKETTDNLGWDTKSLHSQSQKIESEGNGLTKQTFSGDDSVKNSRCNFYY